MLLSLKMFSPAGNNVLSLLKSYFSSCSVHATLFDSGWKLASTVKIASAALVDVVAHGSIGGGNGDGDGDEATASLGGEQQQQQQQQEQQQQQLLQSVAES